MPESDKKGSIGSIWIIGLSSSGKSTLADLLVKKLWENGIPNMLLDGDHIRDIFEERLGYDIESRRKQTRRVLRLTQWVYGRGILPIVAIIHPCEEDRIMCRKILKGYFEVYLKCDLRICMKRDSKHIYSPALKGETRNVVGLDIPYETPEKSDLILESDKLSSEEMLEIVWNKVKENIFPRSKVKIQNQKRSSVCAG